MPLYYKGTKIENVYYKGTKLDKVYYKGTLIYESTIYIAKPTVSGSYTFDTKSHSAAVSNYNSAGCTQSGTASATSSGTYKLTYTLKPGYAWADGSTGTLTYTWTIAKRKLTKTPSLSATSFTWAQGTKHTVTVNNLDSTYVSQSGTLTQTDGASNMNKSYTVTWSLKYPKDTTWSDGTTANKTATWKVAAGNVTIKLQLTTAQVYTVTIACRLWADYTAKDSMVLSYYDDSKVRNEFRPLENMRIYRQPKSYSGTTYFYWCNNIGNDIAPVDGKTYTYTYGGAAD